MSVDVSKLSSTALKRIISIREQIEGLESEIQNIVSGGTSNISKDKVIRVKAKRGRKMSAEAREKIAAGQRARWAKVKSGKR